MCQTRSHSPFNLQLVKAIIRIPKQPASMIKYWTIACLCLVGAQTQGLCEEIEYCLQEMQGHNVWCHRANGNCPPCLDQFATSGESPRYTCVAPINNECPRGATKADCRTASLPDTKAPRKADDASSNSTEKDAADETNAGFRIKYITGLMVGAAAFGLILR